MSFKKTAETLREGAHTLERDYYVNPQILIKEYDNIFLNNWICAGRSSELSKNGEYKTFNMSTESAIILRDSIGNLKAHANVCRHRGTRICDKLSGKFSNVESLKLIEHRYTVNNFDKEDYPLHSISIAEWEGFIFINFNDHPEKFENAFSPILKKFENWDISELIPLETKTYNVAGNWKLVIQNYCECYHCPILHPELAAITPYLGGRNDMHSGPFLGGYMNLNKDKQSVTKSGQLCCPPLNNVDKDDLNKVYYYSIAPNMLISLHPEYVMYHTVWPNGVDKCIVNCSWLFNKDIINSSKYNTLDAVNFWDMTNKQDWHISELSQLGIQSKKYLPAPYSGQESLLAAFDQYYKYSLNN